MVVLTSSLGGSVDCSILLAEDVEGRHDEVAVGGVVDVSEGFNTGALAQSVLVPVARVDRVHSAATTGSGELQEVARWEIASSEWQSTPAGLVELTTHGGLWGESAGV